MFSPILPWRDRLRLLKEPFIKPLPAGAPEETLAEFCDRRLGYMARQKLLTPVVSGIYAGDPEKLGAESAFPAMVEWEQKYGSLVRAMIKGGGPPPRGRLQTFREGFQQLAERLVQALGEGYHPQRTASSIKPTSDGWSVSTANGEVFKARDLVLATAATDAARLLEGLDAELAKELAAIRYSPMGVVHIGARREHTGNMPEGFGFLVPRNEGLRILGAIFSSRLFKGRAPAGYELLTIFTGGALDPEVLALDDERIIEFVREDLRTALGGEWELALSRVTRWPMAIPQYEVGHKDRLLRIGQQLQQHPGLSLLGNWRGGVSMPDCAREGKLAAAAIMSRHQL
jgi:oxygen-dependent protoporphyrinogen oxidase